MFLYDFIRFLYKKKVFTIQSELASIVSRCASILIASQSWARREFTRRWRAILPQLESGELMAILREIGQRSNSRDFSTMYDVEIYKNERGL